MKKLYLFDLDETLFEHENRTASVVHHADGTKTRLSIASENSPSTYEYKRGDRWDWSEFRSAKHFSKSAVPVPSLINLLNEFAKEHDVAIVTARADFDDPDHFGEFLLTHGIDFRKIHVYRAGNRADGPAHTMKADEIRDILLENKYSEVSLYDDSKANLVAFLDLKILFPEVTFYAYHVYKAEINALEV